MHGEQPLHLALRQVDAVDQRLQRPVGGVARFGRSTSSARLSESVAASMSRAICNRVGSGVVDLARHALAQIFHLGRHAQQPVLEIGVFAARTATGSVSGAGVSISGRGSTRPAP